MDAEKVIEKIRSDAKAEADQIAQEANDSLAAQKQEFEKELQQFKKETDVLASRAAEDKKARMYAAARMQVAKEFLAQKRELLDEVFRRAKERLLTLPDEEYLGLMQKLMSEAAGQGEADVIVGTDEGRIDARFVEQVSRQLGEGKKLHFSNKREGISGGFVLQAGRVRTNVSVEVLLDQARSELESELAKELFGN